MVTTGYLPNIAYNFGFFKNLAVNCLQRGDWAGATSGLYSLNGCLGADYLITINTKQYNQKMKDNNYFICGNCTMVINKIINKGEDDEYVKQVECPTEIPLTGIKIVELICPMLEYVVSCEKTIKVWYCPNCNKINELHRTKQIQFERERPYYAKVIPEPPIKQIGLQNRFNYEHDFTKWFWNFLEEINWGEVAYRKEYISQNGHDMEAGYFDKGDK